MGVQFFRAIQPTVRSLVGFAAGGFSPWPRLAFLRQISGGGRQFQQNGIRLRRRLCQANPTRLRGLFTRWSGVNGIRSPPCSLLLVLENQTECYSKIGRIGQRFAERPIVLVAEAKLLFESRERQQINRLLQLGAADDFSSCVPDDLGNRVQPVPQALWHFGHGHAPLIALAVVSSTNFRASSSCSAT